MDQFLQLFDRFGRHLSYVLSYPLHQSERIYFLYLLSSLAFAVGVYLLSPARKQDRAEGRGVFKGLFHFVFPKEIWRHRSTWVDIRYFVPQQLVRLWIYTDIIAGSTQLVDRGMSWILGAFFRQGDLFSVSPHSPELIVGYTLVYLLLLDFASFYIHYLQHKIPTLWEFHKIHHSAEVLQPLSNYREHPVDNVAYAIATGIAAGFAISIFRMVFDVDPTVLIYAILGLPALVFAYNFLGYNLRHSHIWVRWPGVFAYLFGCPAHHQIHHSCKPQHINKNFAFMFPLWDLLFGTFYLPKEEEELVIGLGDGTEAEYRSFLTMYTLPFRNLLKKHAPTPETDRGVEPLDAQLESIELPEGFETADSSADVV